MQSDAKQVEINEYAQRLIKKTARMLVGKAGLTNSDVEDLEQELTLELLKRLPGFDPARAALNTFVTVVIRAHAKKILEQRSCKMRDCGREAFSLNEDTHDGRERWVERGDFVSREEDDRRLGARSERDRRDMVLDVNAVLSRLPEDVRKLCELVKTVTVSEAARRLGMPESTASKRLRDLRERFRKAGLDDYLGNPM
jgi:RNA polymerase sigma-70 factor (ECF subfamily)